MRIQRPDCLIIGGGPAGGMLAWQLAKRGVEVVLLDHGRPHYSGPFETVLASTKAAWQRMGLLESVTSGVTPDPLRHGTIWGADEIAWRDGDQVGLLLERGAFDRGLREAARSAGATVHEGLRAETSGDEWTVGGEVLAPKTVAIATGRSAMVQLPKPVATGVATTAITALGPPAAEDRGTAVVEAVAQGWIWTHCPSVGDASAAVMLDRVSLKDRSAEDLLTEVFAQARGPAGRLERWHVAHANDATMCHRGVSRDVFVLGDAAATIDPLASQGVEKAMSAAEHAGVAIATVLEQPSSEQIAMRQRLCAIHSRWELGLQAAHSRSGEAFYRQEVRFQDAPFWHRRRGEGREQASFERVVLRLRESVRAGRVLMRHGPRFVEVEGAIDSATGEELARISRVPIAPLLPLFALPKMLSEAVQQASQAPDLFVLTPHEVHEALVQLAVRGWLEPA